MNLSSLDTFHSDLLAKSFIDFINFEIEKFSIVPSILLKVSNVSQLTSFQPSFSNLTSFSFAYSFILYQSYNLVCHFSYVFSSPNSLC